jgi:UDP-N-acetylmuramyl pentapeptide synthase
MRAAITTVAGLAATGGAKAVAILGDMLELGEHEDTEHAAIGKFLARQKIGHLVTFGERSAHTAKTARAAGVPYVLETDDPDKAARQAIEWTQPGDWILVKASRGMRLERVVEALG